MIVTARAAARNVTGVSLDPQSNPTPLGRKLGTTSLASFFTAKATITTEFVYGQVERAFDEMLELVAAIQLRTR